MNGSGLALGIVGVLAVAGVARQRGSAAQYRIDPMLVRDAWASLPVLIRIDIKSFQAGVIAGRVPALESQLADAAPAVERAMRPIREAVAAIGSVRLYRGEPDVIQRVPRAWLSWTDDRSMAQRFAGPTGTVRVMEVRPEQIVAVVPHGDANEWFIREPLGSANGTTARRTDPVLWEAVKAQVTAGDKGGRPGQWSARKAQLAVKLYKERGGDYLGPKSPRNSLVRWTEQDWRTKSGKPSLETGERYLPAAAIASLTPAEYAATSKAKRAGMKKGVQFVEQPENIAKKVKRFR